MVTSDLIGWSALASMLGFVVFRAGFRMGQEKTVQHNDRQDGARQQESTFYFRGLSFLLSNEPDKAIESFIHAVRINSETVEIHLSLGNLYRARGEVGRAIRIHQNIIARPDLSDTNRTSALFALAEDYRQGGFLDRAAEAYRQVLAVDPKHQKSLIGLQALHESEGRWDLALEVLQTLEQVSGQTDARRKAHLLLRHGLEQQEKLASSGLQDDGVAQKAFLAAIKAYPGCVEAYRLMGEAHWEAGKPRAAIQSFSAVQKNRPSHFFLLVNSLRKAYDLIEDEKGFHAFMTAAVMAPSASAPLMVCWSQILEEQNHRDEAIQLLQRGVTQYPGSARLVRRLVVLLRHKNQWESATSVAINYLDQVLSRQPVFQCSRCGFKSQDISWNCPQCHAWDTMEPLST